MIQVIKGDITTVYADAIVNAANELLQGGGGVDGAIHAVAGPDLAKEAGKYGPVTAGEKVVVTDSYKLPAEYIFHVVGPRYNQYADKNEAAAILYKCYTDALEEALKLQLDSISFPNIGTGIFGYPQEDALEVVQLAVSTYKDKLDIIFVCFDDKNYTLYKEAFKK